MKRSLKNIACGLFTSLMFIMGGACGVIEHIEDTNGAENFTLQTITDENIIRLDTGSRGVTETTNNITNTVTYSSKKFTGVYEIYGENIWTTRYEIIVNHARVDSGNFKMVLVVDDEIVHEFALNELTQSFVLENGVSGYVALRIAGESANFQFDYYVL